MFNIIDRVDIVLKMKESTSKIFTGGATANDSSGKDQRQGTRPTQRFPHLNAGALITVTTGILTHRPIRGV
jgi:hypothetical protein